MLGNFASFTTTTTTTENEPHKCLLPSHNGLVRLSENGLTTTRYAADFLASGILDNLDKNFEIGVKFRKLTM